ncbi:alpha/beta hydrolase (plasmid) [Deinococcus sp. KNUC1210]|uniref:alpha/beta fold hydrolase n=1 Tax=Deinococcus sp. KNUC1210 TaxID=2917691 RepID=UPI001EEFED77|nr:alpha/beta hydrolase [Deinococcus sp. KNUC1210]ULH18293.1 alpha/beta hydrolase [Deinococcus sp. KNUC1210]
MTHLQRPASRHLIAVHGNFASSAWWTDLRAVPPVGWEVHTPDLPGFAGTPHSGEVSIARYADWLTQYVAAHRLERPVLLGHSLGGAVVLEAASRAPDAYAGLVLAASAPLTGLVTPEAQYPVLEQLPANAALLNLSLEALFPSGRPDNFRHLLQDAARMAPALYSGNARALAAWSVAPETLTGLPTLILGGELDLLITPERVTAQGKALNVPVSLLQGVGHGFPQEAPGIFLSELQRFLDLL